MRQTEFRAPSGSGWWRWCNRQYRLLATGLCFLVFMLGGLLVSVTLLPLVQVTARNAKRRKAASIGLIRWLFNLFMRFMRLILVIDSFKVSGLDRLAGRGPHLYIANHPTLIDVVAILGLLKSCNCIVKSELFSNPFMGAVLRRSGLLPNDFGPRLMARIAAEIEQGYSLMLFPEGTRSLQRELRRFQRGAAQIALRTGVQVVPILVRCQPSTLRKGQKWWQVPDRAIEFSLDFQEPLEIPAEILEKPSFPLRVRALTLYFESYFAARL